MAKFPDVKDLTDEELLQLREDLTKILVKKFDQTIRSVAKAKRLIYEADKILGYHKQDAPSYVAIARRKIQEALKEIG